MKALTEVDSSGCRPQCGRAIAAARVASKLSGEDLARKAAISRRTLTKIELGDTTVAFGSYLSVANALGLTWLFDVLFPQATKQTLVPGHYLTGATALSLPSPKSGVPALWYSSAIGTPKTWQISGVHVCDTRPLLGVSQLWDATEEIVKHNVFIQQIWAATHERAVFDLLYHFCECRGGAVPNIQAVDIDDVVDLNLVSGWVGQYEAFISESGRNRMLQWLSKV